VRVHTDPRISRRRKAVARSKRKRYFIGGALVLGVVTLVYLMFWSPVLRVQEVKVVGARHTTSEQIAEVAGLDTSDNLLRISTGAIAARAEELPWVKKADVDRMLPGTVRVRITERTPALLLSLASGEWTIDASGVVLEEGEAVKGLPVLTGVEVGGVTPGDRLQTEEARDALISFKALPAAMRKDVAAVLAPTRERISFSLVTHTVVRFGAAERLDAKNKVLRALLARLRSEHVTPAYIDVRVPTNPAVSTASALTEQPVAAEDDVTGLTPTITASPSPSASPPE
jgi:cell division protein FtsQ